MSLDLTAIKRMHLVEDHPIIATLKALYLFEDMDEIEIGTIVSRSPIETHDRWVVLLSEWEASNGKAYVILSGSVEVSIDGDVFSTLSTGAIFGEYALICQEPRTASVRTITPVECLVLDEESIMGIVSEGNELNKIMTRRINENVEKGRGVFKEE